MIKLKCRTDCDLNYKPAEQYYTKHFNKLRVRQGANELPYSHILRFTTSGNAIYCLQLELSIVF
jgi:hypothetical protein